jgi:hypothetical protein
MRSFFRHQRARRPACAMGILPLLLGSWLGAAIAPVAAEEKSAATMDAGGMFLPGDDPRELWRQTRLKVAADWPVARFVEPDFIIARKVLAKSP